MEPSESLEWRQARQWLIVSGVIPPTHRVTKPDVDLVDFARSLRDGVFLCGLLLQLKPDCIKDSDWNNKPLMQHSYLKNISAFLSACRYKFKMSDSDLFAESDLYDVDNFQKVMHLLSRLSHSSEALSKGWIPFPQAASRDYYNQSNNDDIYASLKDIGMGRIYANMDELYTEVAPDDEDPYGYGDESIYDSICYYQAPPSKTNDSDEKKMCVLHELYETEKSFLSVLELISQTFCSAICDHISPEDNDLLFSTAKLLHPVHCQLLEAFEKCVQSGSADVSPYFLNAREGLLDYGAYAAKLPRAIERSKQLQTRGETARQLQLCQSRSNQRFPLNDLLSVPIQRFLKYPLLIKELHKCSKKSAMPRDTEVKNLESVLALLEDIARYINSTKGDYDSMKQIEEVEMSLVDYRGPPLHQCGRYHLDGELRVKQDIRSDRKEVRWAFLFDKVMLICRKANRLGFDVRHSPKHVFSVSTLRVEPIYNNPVRGGKFTYAFRLTVEGHGEFIAFAKTEELRSQWVDAINHAKEMSCPREGKKGHHSFELTTFDKPSFCNVCQKLLHGCYFQGYMCSSCSRAVHRDCLKSVDRCNTMQRQFPPGAGGHRPLVASLSSGGPPLPNSSVLRSTRWTPGATENTRLAGHIYIAKERYDAIGSRSNRVLSFERGEELEVFNPLPSAEWWEAISLRTGNKGEVPASYLVKKSDEEVATANGGRQGGLEERLKGYPWYLGKKSRIDAEQALHRMKDGVFLIRESDVRPGEYAIALKWKKMPKHIKICKHPETRKFYVSDVCEFLSVEELVAYYQQNSLGSSFPGVDTTLSHPYHDMVDGERRSRSTSIPPAPTFPPPTHPPQSDRWAEVLFNFTAEYPDELTIDRHDRVKILDKNTNKLGWWLGEFNGKTGLFPSNYVREISS